MAASKPIGIAVVGTGTIAEAVHLPALRRLGARYEVQAVCDLSLRRAEFVAARTGRDVVATRRAEEAVARPGVEAVLIASSGSHGRLARLALEAGKHVLSEKPLCLGVAEALELEREAAERRLVLQVGYMKMYDLIVERAQDELARLAHPRHVRVTVLHPADRHQLAHLRPSPFDDVDPAAIEEVEAYEAARTAEAIGDVPGWLAGLYSGVLNGSLVHELSLLRALGISLPGSFDYATAWRGAAAGDTPCVLGVASLAPETQLTIAWEWLPEYAEYREEVAVFADDGRLLLDVAPPYLLDVRSTLRVERSAGVTRDVTESFGDHESGFSRQLAEFAASVRDGAPVRSTAQGAACDIRCLQALAAAIARQHGVTVGGEAGEIG